MHAAFEFMYTQYIRICPVKGKIMSCVKDTSEGVNIETATVQLRFPAAPKVASRH